MNKYNIVYSDYYRQIWVLILFPVVMITPLIVILLSLKDLSQTFILVAIVVWMGLMIALMIYVVTKQLMVSATLQIDSAGLEITPERRTIFYRLKNLSISFDNIRSVTDDEDIQQNYRKFFTLKTKCPSRKIMLLAPKNQSKAETERCTLALHAAIKNYNQSDVAAASGIIKEGSFYTSTFAKFITLLFAAVIVIAAAAKLADPESVPWYRLVALCSFAILWFANFYNAQRKEEGRHDN